jgi:uncharacterized protein DUF6504
MRQYDDLVDVRKGLVAGSHGEVSGPEQFLWRGRLWKVHDVVAHWVETGPWWQSAEVAAVLGAEDQPADGSVEAAVAHEVLAEREVWRVEAAHPRPASGAHGVFDLTFDWARGSWALTRCLD